MGVERSKQSSALDNPKHVSLLGDQTTFLVKTIDFTENQKMPKLKKNSVTA